MPVNLPNEILAGTPQDASQIQGNFEALAAKFNAGIIDSDISNSANITGTKLATGSVPGAKLVPLSVTGGVSGQIALTTITNENITDTTIKKAKHATAVGDAISFSQLDIKVDEVSIGPITINTVFWGATVGRHTTGANYDATLQVITGNVSTINSNDANDIVQTTTNVTVTPGTPIQTANRIVLSVYLADTVLAGTQFNCKVCFTHMARV